MPLQIETIRATAARVAASHHLDVIDLEFTGGAKHRVLRVFVEKDAATRAQLAANSGAAETQDGTLVPTGVPAEALSGVTHEDCANFARDFGAVLDVEDLIPGTEYILEVSSPGLERKLLRAADYDRFKGSLIKLQTFSALAGNRHFTGRLTGFDGACLTLDLAAAGRSSKARKTVAPQTVEIDLANVEKANLVAEI